MLCLFLLLLLCCSLSFLDGSARSENFDLRELDDSLLSGAFGSSNSINLPTWLTKLFLFSKSTIRELLLEVTALVVVYYFSLLSLSVSTAAAYSASFFSYSSLAYFSCYYFNFNSAAS